MSSSSLGGKMVFPGGLFEVHLLTWVKMSEIILQGHKTQFEKHYLVTTDVAIRCLLL